MNDQLTVGNSPLMANAVPALRFPEFSGGWEPTNLGAESTCLDNKRIPLKEADRSKRDGIYPYYGASGVIDYLDDYLFDETLVLLAEDGANIIMRNSAIAFLAKGKYWVNNHAHVYRAKGSSEFLATYLENLRYEKYNTGTAQPKLNGEACKKLKLNFPPLSEQQKIATFLTSVDTKIEQLGKKKSLLEKYKKGMMQKLFSQALRFKDELGNDFPDWDKKRLGEACNFIKSGKDKLATKGDFPIYGSTSQLGQTDTPSFEGKHLLVARVGANAGKLNIVNSKFGVTDNTLVIALKENFSSEFVYSLLVALNLNKLVFGSGQPLITGGMLKNLVIKFPSFLEQQKIANFFTALGNKIDLTTTELNQAKTFKKGLLQKMFV